MIDVKYTRWLMIAGIIFLLLWLLWKNFVPNGRLEIKHNLAKPNAAVTDFRPGEKMKPWQKEGDAVFHSLLSGPIFFHVYVPRQFQSAQFTIRYRAKKTHDAQFGYQIGPELYAFHYQSMHIIADGAWHDARLDFDLGKAYFHQSNSRYQFSFSEVDGLDVAGFDVKLVKPSITLFRLIDVARNSLRQ